MLMALPGLVAFGQQKVIIGYVGGYRGLIKPGMVDASKITHLNYAFVNVIANRAILSRERTDTVNLRNLTLLRKANPRLKILISIGGWTWSGGFSDAVLSDTSRQAFAASAIAIVKRFNLDGIDIDWEYPDQTGNGNINRKEDKQNYTLMFAELRKQLTGLGLQLHKPMLLTTATGGFSNFLRHTEMNKASVYLDYINLMTYDYFGNGSAIHHTNLYASKTYTGRDNADNAVSAYIAAGVPASKMVLGVAFYGRVFQLPDSAKKGLGDINSKHLRQLGYDMIRDSLLTDKALGFIAYRDTAAMAPYLFSNINHQFVTYDDIWSIDNKCKYVLQHQLAGVMFWEYDSDPKSYLLDEVNEDLNKVK
ncbi:chitinase [Mucilaginibacter sp. PPCGB 2223]|nr:chitinase [Mucilaginibacter sp. PPCGB 2223]